MHSFRKNLSCRFFDCENQEDEIECENEVEFECKMGPADKDTQSGRLPQLYICDGYVIAEPRDVIFKVT